MILSQETNFAFFFTHLENMFVFIDGNIGAGKSSCLRFLSSKYTIIEEPLHLWRNVLGVNLLERFYSDRARYAFSFQMYVLFTYVSALKLAVCPSYVIVERSLGAQLHVFVKQLHGCGILSDTEFAVYSSIYNQFNFDGLYIYLKCSSSECMERIKKRGRSDELLDLAYISDLDKKYDEYYELITDAYVLDVTDMETAEVAKVIDGYIESR